VRAGYTLNTAVTLATSTNNVAQLDATGPNVMVVRLSGLTVSNSHLIKLTGTKPIIFLVNGNVLVDSNGKIDAGAAGTTPGAGGSIAGQCIGQTGGSNAIVKDGGGGGGFGTAGGAGGDGPAAGAISSDSDLQPLRGGCSGGAGGNGTISGGAGGGAVQITASGTITIGTAANVATVSAAGGGGRGVTTNNTGAGGGGSGGAILLEAPATPVLGTNGATRAHGGGGGEGSSNQNGSAGADGSLSSNTAASGGSGASGGDGAGGGLCAGNNCATATADGLSGLQGSSTSVGYGGGGGGGGRIQIVQHGTPGQCPADAFAASGTLCRAAVAGGCDVAETCTGSAATCPADAVVAAGTVCRSLAGPCDAAETCNGTNTCPADSLATAGTLCRASIGPCDPVAEACTGSSITCPADTAAPSTTVCRAAATVCDAAESCTGASTTCPADGFAPSSTVCRPAATVCDVADQCTGSSSTCPADAFAPNSTVCRAAVSVCDAAEKCTGSSSSCPADAFAPSTTQCSDQTNICDAVDFCTGTSSTCPDGFAPLGTICGYGTGALVIYSTGLPANSLDTSSRFTFQTLTNEGPTSAWPDAMKFTATSNGSGAGKFIYWKISTTPHTFLSTEYIEYDVYLAQDQSGIGGIDVATASGYLKTGPVGPAFDQNNLSSAPAIDISPEAFGQWYHRRFPLNGLGIVGKSSTIWDVVDENDTSSSTFTAYYDNLMVTTKQGVCNGANACKLRDDQPCTLASQCAANACTNSLCGPPIPNGTACTGVGRCISGNCVDGVCCNTACAGVVPPPGEIDCQACSTAAGAAVNGTCGFASSTTVCRASIASCDVAELCTGSNNACPLDTQ
jgi:hypothetical protein